MVCIVSMLVYLILANVNLICGIEWVFIIFRFQVRSCQLPVTSGKGGEERVALDGGVNEGTVDFIRFQEGFGVKL